MLFIEDLFELLELKHFERWDRDSSATSYQLWIINIGGDGIHIANLMTEYLMVKNAFITWKDGQIPYIHNIITL